MSTALKVNGSPDKVSFGNILLTQTVVTAGMWIFPTANSSSNQETIFGYGNTRWFFIYGNTTTKLRFSAIAGGSEKNTGNTVNALPLNQWSFIIGTYDPNGGTNNITLRVYDQFGNFVEEKDATITGAIGTTSQPIEAGHDPARGFYIKAEFQYLKVWSRILTVTEQDNVAKLNSVVNGLVGSWNLDEGSGTVANDTSGSGNNGTITGSTWVTGMTTTSTSTSTTTTTTSTSTTISTSTTTTFGYSMNIENSPTEMEITTIWGNSEN